MQHSLQADYMLGYLGGGQLARMSANEALKLGIRIGGFVTSSDTEPIELMTPHITRSDFNNVDALIKFAKSCDVVTLENEFIDSDILMRMRDESQTPLFPTPETFRLIENKLIEKQTFEKAGIPVTPYALIHNHDELADFGETHGWPYVLKSSKGGYDGYGNETVHSIDEAIDAFKKLGGLAGHDVIAEAFVPFTKELAVQVARNRTGMVVYPCCETVQENHICTMVISPADIDPKMAREAQEIAKAATEAIDGIGLFAYEFFLTKDGKILLNESAPRPHNSGHYTIEGTIASQFENHVRAVMGLPLGSAELRRPFSVMVNLLGTHKRPALVENIEGVFTCSDAHLHIYGKENSKVGRKMGHMTLLGDRLDETVKKALSLTKNIKI